MARRGTGLGFANVIAYDPYASAVKAQALGVKLVSWEEALAQGDFFSLHMPMTPQTKVLPCCPACYLERGNEAFLLLAPCLTCTHKRGAPPIPDQSCK